MEKKTILVYPGLQYAHKELNFGKRLFVYKNRFAVEKKFGANSKLLGKIFVSPSKKNASHTISIFGNCMISIFFKKRKPRILITIFVLLESNNRKKLVYIFFYLFFEIV